MTPKATKTLFAVLGLACFLAGPSAPFSPPALSNSAEAAKFSPPNSRAFHRGRQYRPAVGMSTKMRRRLMEQPGRAGQNRRMGETRNRLKPPRHHREHRIHRRAGQGVGIYVNLIDAQNVKKRKKSLTAAQLRRLKLKTARLARGRIVSLYKNRVEEGKMYRAKSRYIREIYKKYGLARIDRGILNAGKLILKDAKKLKKNPKANMRTSFKRRSRRLLKIIIATQYALRRVKQALKKPKQLNKAQNQKFIKVLSQDKNILDNILRETRKIRKLYVGAIRAGVK